MSTWLEAKVPHHPYMVPVLDLFRRALSGHPIDMSRDDWASLIPDAVKADGPLAGCLSRHHDQWREIAPDRRDLWRMLRNGWHDPKVDQDCPHAATSAAPPPRSTGQIAIEQQYPKMQQMGVIAPVMDPPVTPISSNRFHILRNAPQDKKDEHGNVTDEVRVVTATKSESSNEDMPKYRGTSPDDFSRWIKPRQVTLKGDLSKMFWQVNATKSQRDLMMFYWGDRLFQWTVMVMGMAGSGYWATNITNMVRSYLLVRFLIDIFTYVDEWAVQNTKLLICYLEQAFTVTTLVWLGARPNMAKTQLAFSPDRVPTITLFIGITADSMLNRVSPSPARMGVIREQAAFILREFHSGRGVPWSELRQLKARITSCTRIHMLAGFLTVRMSTVHRQFLQKYGSSKPAHRAEIPSSVIQYTARELQYWAVHPVADAWRPACYPTPSETGVVDASTYRMAMHGRSLRLQEFFFSMPMTEAEREISHNAMETLTVTKSVPVIVRDGHMRPGSALHPVGMDVLADNVTTVQALNRLTTNSIFIAEMMVEFIRWQAANNFWVSGYYHPKALMDSQKAQAGLGVGMTTDEASRTYGGLWARAIPMTIFNRVCDHFQIPPATVIDMLACNNSARSPRYVSRLPDMGNLWTDAFNPLFPWDCQSNPHINQNDVLYCYAPPKIIARVMARMEHTSNYVLLVTRFDSSLPARLLQSQQGFPPLTFGVEIKDLEAPEGPSAPILTGGRMTLLASLFSPPSSSLQETHLKPSARLSVADGPQPQISPNQQYVLSPVSRSGRVGSAAEGMVYLTSQDRR